MQDYQSEVSKAHETLMLQLEELPEDTDHQKLFELIVQIATLSQHLFKQQMQQDQQKLEDSIKVEVVLLKKEYNTWKVLGITTVSGAVSIASGALGIGALKWGDHLSKVGTALSSGSHAADGFGKLADNHGQGERTLKQQRLEELKRLQQEGDDSVRRTSEKETRLMSTLESSNNAVHRAASSVIGAQA